MHNIQVKTYWTSISNCCIVCNLWVESYSDHLIGYAPYSGLNQDYMDVNYNYFIVPVLHIIAAV